MLDAECKEARRSAERRTNAEGVGATTNAKPTSLGRCEAMLKVLNRDDSMRAIYVRRRWQGLVDEINLASPRPNDSGK